jgi:hypothetical protein
MNLKENWKFLRRAVETSPGFDPRGPLYTVNCIHWAQFRIQTNKTKKKHKNTKQNEISKEFSPYFEGRQKDFIQNIRIIWQGLKRNLKKTFSCHL